MMNTVQYEGRAQLGDNDPAVEVVVQIPDVEHPDWFALIVEHVVVPCGEVTVTLLDGDLYNAWRGSAVISNGADGSSRLLGLEPLTPPVGG